MTRFVSITNKTYVMFSFFDMRTNLAINLSGMDSQDWLGWPADLGGLGHPVCLDWSGWWDNQSAQEWLAGQSGKCC